MATAIAASTEKLDALLTLLTDCSSEECRITREHVAAARFYLLGAMDKEYILSVDSARKAISAIPDETVRTEAQRMLATIAV